MRCIEKTRWLKHTTITLRKLLHTQLSKFLQRLPSSFGSSVSTRSLWVWLTCRSSKTWACCCVTLSSSICSRLGFWLHCLHSQRLYVDLFWVYYSWTSLRKEDCSTWQGLFWRRRATLGSFISVKTVGFGLLSCPFSWTNWGSAFCCQTFGQHWQFW
jgi:hypothetical protein